MWVYLVGLCLVFTAVYGDDQRSALFEPAPTVQIQNNVQTTPYTDMALPDLNKYVSNTALPVPSSSVPSVNFNAPEYQALAKAAPYYDINSPSNLADFSNYSPILPVSNQPLLLQTRNQGNGLLQSIIAVPYKQPQQPVNCVNSEVLTKVWTILSSIVESIGNPSPTITHMDQIKYALTLIKNYLQETNTGQNNELMWRLLLLENELHKDNVPAYNNHRSFNNYIPTIPAQKDNTPRPELKYKILTNLNAECWQALMGLFLWAQEAYGNLMKSPCGSVGVASSTYEGNMIPSPASYNIARKSLIEFPYSYQLLRQNPRNTASYSYVQTSASYPSLTGHLSQQPYNDINSYFQIASTFPVISQTNQEQYNTASNPFLQTPSSYNSLIGLINQNPYVYQISDTKSTVNDLLGQINISGNINPIQPPPTYPTLMPQVSGSSITAGNVLNPQLPARSSFSRKLQDLQHITGISKLLTNNLQQQQANSVTYPGTAVVHPNYLILKNDAADKSNVFNSINVQPNQQLDPSAIQRLMQNIPITNGFYKNIEKYLNSHFVQNNWNTPQQYSQIPYQSPYTNTINPTFTRIKELYDATKKNQYGFGQDVFKNTQSTRQSLPTIDWSSIANESKLNSDITTKGEVELTYALKNPRPENQPLYFVKYRLPYDMFMQNVKNLLSTGSAKSDLSKDLVLKSNASEVPRDLASYPNEEVRNLVVKEGDLIKARYIEANRTNDKDSSAADSINELLSKAINADPGINSLNSPNQPKNNDMANPHEYGNGPAGPLYSPVNPYQHQQGGQGLYRNSPLQRGPNSFGQNYQPGSPYQFGLNGPMQPQAGGVNPFNSMNPGL